jgi:hypothetical protein
LNFDWLFSGGSIYTVIAYYYYLKLRANTSPQVVGKSLKDSRLARYFAHSSCTRENIHNAHILSCVKNQLAVVKNYHNSISTFLETKAPVLLPIYTRLVAFFAPQSTTPAAPEIVE